MRRGIMIDVTGMHRARTVSLEELRGSRRRRRRESAIRGAFFTAAAISLVISGLIILSLAGRAAQFLQEVDLSKLWTIGWFPRRGLFDIQTMAGIPSVVMGYFALTFLSPHLIQSLFSGATIFNLSAAGIGVGILVVP